MIATEYLTNKIAETFLDSSEIILLTKTYSEKIEGFNKIIKLPVLKDGNYTPYYEVSGSGYVRYNLIKDLDKYCYKVLEPDWDIINGVAVINKDNKVLWYEIFDYNIVVETIVAEIILYMSFDIKCEGVYKRIA